VIPVPAVYAPIPQGTSLTSFSPKYLTDPNRIDLYEQMFAWPLICAVANDTRRAREASGYPLSDQAKAETAARLLMESDKQWTASDAVTQWARLSQNPPEYWKTALEQWAEQGRDPIAAETFPQGADWVMAQMPDI
jgi:hypothetical protein